MSDIFAAFQGYDERPLERKLGRNDTILEEDEFHRDSPIPELRTMP